MINNYKKSKSVSHTLFPFLLLFSPSSSSHLPLFSPSFPLSNSRCSEWYKFPGTVLFHMHDQVSWCWQVHMPFLDAVTLSHFSHSFVPPAHDFFLSFKSMWCTRGFSRLSSSGLLAWLFCPWYVSPKRTFPNYRRKKGAKYYFMYIICLCFDGRTVSNWWLIMVTEFGFL